jgi:glycosyltransferase involved in cell wall biosynthesis
MIVKNEEKNLPRALASVAGIADEVIVVDTGSTDRTVEIAKEFGQRCFSSTGAMIFRQRGMNP